MFADRRRRGAATRHTAHTPFRFTGVLHLPPMALPIHLCVCDSTVHRNSLHARTRVRLGLTHLLPPRVPV